jgi:hypothetical protein
MIDSSDLVTKKPLSNAKIAPDKRLSIEAQANQYDIFRATLKKMPQSLKKDKVILDIELTLKKIEKFIDV